MSDVVVLQPIARSGIALLENAGLDVFVAPKPTLATFRHHLSAARAVITRNHGFSEKELAAAPCLRVIAVHGTGMDKVEHAAAAARGVAVVNTPGVNARSVAELALGLMLACAREIPAADDVARTCDHAWRDRHPGIELGGRRLGLVGFGHVARALVPMAKGLGMEVSVCSHHTDQAMLTDLGVRLAPDIDALCAGVDVLSLHALPGSRPLIDARLLALMPRGAILVNTARGALVDEAALAAALASGNLRCAALDVTMDEPLRPENPLLSAPRLLLTPHIGGTTVEAMERAGQEVARLLIAALDRLS